MRALRNYFIEGLMYKRSVVISYLKCLRALEVEEPLKEAHEGIYGHHLGGRALTHKITRWRFYWPIMLADIKDYVKNTTDARDFKEYYDDKSIELCFISVAHPQENGKSMVANRIILDGLKKMVECLRNTWVDKLLPIISAYHTTCKVTTKAAPFMVAYEAGEVVPVEITH
ncbi:uncharacterized protein LOC141714803 [Apium graveolens]|uniref:uncharacterized protein LOC141714803 n=1 Tax=Apium graveolens TaxID=4045 RepID=UPI003D7AE2FE